MMRERSVRAAAMLAGALALAVLLLLILLMPAAWRETAREWTFDAVLALDKAVRKPAPATTPAVIVVDIDRESLQRGGPWPWPRAQVARLVDAIAEAGPAAIGIDILFAEPDARSPAALARMLGEAAGRPDIAALGDTLTDGDRDLATALARIPVVLGIALDPQERSQLRSPPIIVRGSPDLDPWQSAGVVAPPDVLVNASAGVGALALPGDADGIVRRLPLLVTIADRVHAGLAAELLRAGLQASAYLVQADPQVLQIGDRRIALGSDVLLRLAPVPVERHAARTLSAAAVMNRADDRAKIRNAVVLVGGSAPELGGLRATVQDALTPSVQIQADAVEQMLRQRSPLQLFPPDWELAGSMVAGVLATAIGVILAPGLGAIVVAALVAATWVGAVGLSLSGDWLTDPVTPSLAMTLAFAASSISAYAHTRLREQRVRRRFEQHLAPAVVERIVAQPGLLKLAGERREVTALFTDIEGFTALTRRAGPDALIAVLDGYFEGITKIVVAYGGMVDKMVGDAIHALFNAPLDLADHPQRAVECALAIHNWSETYRASDLPKSLGLGRTRIGIETGPAVVGDVGVGAKLDYTAHGDAVNMAARLEAANKDLGSTICVGPGTIARCNPQNFVSLRTINVRGRDEPVTVFTPKKLVDQA